MDKIIFVLNLIVDYIDFNDVINENELTNYLIFTGFDDYVINQVLTITGINNDNKKKNVRVFTNKEKSAFSKEALYYLEKLFLIGIINFIEGEEIIEESMKDKSHNISIDIVKEHTLSILLEKKSFTQKINIYNEDFSH